MALTAATMSLAGSAAVVSGRKPSSSSLSPFSTQLRPRRLGAVRVRSQAEKPQEPATSPVDSPPPKASPPPPPATPKMSTKFSDVLAFSGPAPERINGRLAMVGFVAALGMELARGDGLAAQLAVDDGLTWFLVTASVLSVASLVPLFKGVTAESKSGGLMTSDAELWNGRFAMLGLVALAFTEYVKGGPLV